MQRLVQCHKDLLLNARECSQIDHPQQPPSHDAKHVHAEQVRDAGAFSNGRQDLNCNVDQWVFLLPRTLATICCTLLPITLALKRRSVSTIRSLRNFLRACIAVPLGALLPSAIAQGRSVSRSRLNTRVMDSTKATITMTDGITRSDMRRKQVVSRMDPTIAL